MAQSVSPVTTGNHPHVHDRDRDRDRDRDGDTPPSPALPNPVVEPTNQPPGRGYGGDDSTQ